MTVPLPQPILENERVRLRPFSPEDAPVVQALAGAKEVASTTLTIPHPYEDGVAEAWIAAHAPGYEAGQTVTYAIVDPRTDQLAGAIGLVVQQAHARAELGYWIGVPFWNRGLATEAARLLVRFGFEELGLVRIYAHHFVRNPASGRVLRKVGMRHEGRLPAHVRKGEAFEDLDLYGVTSEEWRRDADARPRMYGELASWWPLLSRPSDYAEEAASFEALLVGACEDAPQTLLELGSGGGNNASFLKRRFRTTLVDASPDMLKVSRALNPECEHMEGDMRSVRLGRQFDCVLLHDAISYMRSEADLRLAIETAHVHCKAGGAALFAPDFVRENFRAGSSSGGHDGGERRGMRYLEWWWDPDPSDTEYTTDFAYLLRDHTDSCILLSDHHTCGLFSRGDWLRFLAEAGFEAKVVPFEHSELEPGTHELYLAKKVGRSKEREQGGR